MRANGEMSAEIPQENPLSKVGAATIQELLDELRRRSCGMLCSLVVPGEDNNLIYTVATKGHAVILTALHGQNEREIKELEVRQRKPIGQANNDGGISTGV